MQKLVERFRNTDWKDLATDIRIFLAHHAKIRPDFDPDIEEDSEKFLSGDASELLSAASQLEEGLTPEVPLSSWESGAYCPYEDKQARRRHDHLLKKIKDLKSKEKDNE